MKIDEKWLTEKGACRDGKAWFVDQGITEPVAGIRNLLKHDHWDWANWLVVRVLDRPGYIRYAIFAAEQVIEIFEKKYPEDKRPRKAIESARAVLANDTKETRAAAYAAYDAAYAAAYAAYAAYDAVPAAAYAAAYAAYAAYAAAYAAYAAYDAVPAAAYAAAYAADAANAAAYAAAYAADAAYAAASAAYDAARKEMRTRIIEYGISLLEAERKTK
jgi:hypothetical protein